MLRSLQGEQMYGRNGMIEIYTDQESDFIHLLQKKTSTAKFLWALTFTFKVFPFSPFFYF